MEQNSKDALFKTLAGFLGVVTILVVYSVFWGPAKRYADSLYPARVLSVSGEGKAIITPDIARTSFSIASEGADPVQLVEENNKKMNRVIDFVKAQGIDAKDIKTTQYNLSPKYDYDRLTGRQAIYSYLFNQRVSLKIRDFTKIGKLLAALPEYGENVFGSVNFEVEEPDKYLGEARANAYDAAKKKAREIAAKNGVALGRIVNLGEYAPTPYPRSEGLGGGGDFTSQALRLATVPAVEPGSEEITVQATITYEIE